jgi:hypothetical protein
MHMERCGVRGGAPRVKPEGEMRAWRAHKREGGRALERGIISLVLLVPGRAPTRSSSEEKEKKKAGDLSSRGGVLPSRSNATCVRPRTGA